MHIYLIRLFVLCLSGSLCFASNDDNIFQDQYQILANRAWKEEVAPIINRAFDSLGSGNNVATFRLKATTNIEKEIYKDFSSRFLFVSGGNREVVAELEKKTGYTCYSIYNFYPLVENQPNDRTLRKGIADFFELVDVESENLSNLRANFNDLLETISEPHLSGLKMALKTTFQNHTTLRTFQELNKRDLSIQDLKLINTTREGNQPEPNHFNDVFGDNFLLNFADSEQSIRRFMTRGKGNENVVRENIDFNFKNNSMYYPDEVYTFCKNYEDEYDQLRKKHSNEKKETERDIKATKDSEYKNKLKKDLENRQNTYNNEEDKFFASKKKEYEHTLELWLSKINLSFEVEIFSYFQMCSNCKATFNYDFNHRHLFQRDILVSFLNGLSDNPIKNCFKTLLLTKDIESIKFPKVELKINYIEEYGRSRSC